MGTNYQRQQRGNRSTVKIDVGTFSLFGWFNTACDSPVLIWFNAIQHRSFQDKIRPGITPNPTFSRTNRRRFVLEILLLDGFRRHLYCSNGSNTFVLVRRDRIRHNCNCFRQFISSCYCCVTIFSFQPCNKPVGQNPQDVPDSPCLLFQAPPQEDDHTLVSARLVLRRMNPVNNIMQFSIPFLISFYCYTYLLLSNFYFAERKEPPNLYGMCSSNYPNPLRQAELVPLLSCALTFANSTACHQLATP